MSIPKLNPFLVDTVLDLILSDLTIPEIKSSREVCQFWDFSSINVISHKELSSINLHSEDESTEQILMEISQFPNRNLFRNFDLNWNQLSEPCLHKFLPHFSPIKLTISKSEDLHPESHMNLIQIITPIKDTLQELSLTPPGENPDHLTSILTSLSTLPGLILKGFQLLKIDKYSWSFPEDLQNLTPQIQELFKALEEFLHSQCQFLEILELSLHCRLEASWGHLGELQERSTISLPVFPRVKTWHFNLRGCLRKKNPRSGNWAWNPWELLKPFDFNVKFPALEKFICEPWLFCFRRSLELTQGHPLRSIDSWIYHFPYENMYTSFPEVEELSLKPLELEEGGRKILWVESLKKLTFVFDFSPLEFNLGHLNALEEIEIEILNPNANAKILEDFDKFLNMLQDLKKLEKLKNIKLLGCKFPSDLEKRIQDAFPLINVIIIQD